MSNELAPARFPAIVITAPGRQDVRVICGTWCSPAGQASSVSSGVLTLRLPDPGRKLVGLRLVPDVLREHGYDATLHEVADVHNYTAWRDSFDPHLTRMLRRMRS